MSLRLLGREAVVYGIGNMCMRGVAFVLTPIYTHGLSIDDYGRLSALLLTTQILIMVMGMGARTAFVRFAADFQSQNLLGQLFTSSILVNVLGGLVVGGLTISLFPPLFEGVLHTKDVFEILAFACLAGMCQSLLEHVLAYYRTANESLKFVLVCVFETILSIAINVWFLFGLHLGIKGVLITQALTGGMLSLFIMLDFFSKNRVDTSMAAAWQVFRFGFPLIFVMSGGMVAEAGAVYLLSHFGDLKQVAVFSLANKVAQIAAMVLLVPFQLAYEPFVYGNLNTPGIQVTISRVLTYLMLSFAFVAFGIVFSFRDIFPFIAPAEYFSAYFVVFLILPFLAFRGVFLIGQSLLYIKNRTNVTGICVSIFAAISLLLNYFIIPRWGMVGTIAVINTTSVALAIVVIFLGIRAFPIKLEIGRLAGVGLVAAGLLLAVFHMYEAENYIYYTVIPLFALTTAMGLYVSGFFDDQEARFIRGLFYRVGIRAST
jgi:O-antigen/teichoic acid export membrane protein